MKNLILKQTDQFLIAGSVKFQIIKNLIFQVSFRRKKIILVQMRGQLKLAKAVWYVEEKAWYCRMAGQRSL